MPKYYTFNHAFISDEQLLSSVEDCGKHRTGVSPYCLAHRRANGERSQQLLEPIERTRHAVEHPGVGRIFQNNRDNPSLCDVTGAVQEWVDSAHVFAEDQNIEDGDYRRQSDTTSVPAAGIVRFGYRVHDDGRAVLIVHTMKASTAIEAGMLDQEGVDTIAKLPRTNVAAAYTRVDVQEPGKEPARST